MLFNFCRFGSLLEEVLGNILCFCRCCLSSAFPAVASFAPEIVSVFEHFRALSVFQASLLCAIVDRSERERARVCDSDLLCALSFEEEFAVCFLSEVRRCNHGQGRRGRDVLRDLDCDLVAASWRVSEIRLRAGVLDLSTVDDPGVYSWDFVRSICPLGIRRWTRVLVQVENACLEAEDQHL